MDDRSQTEPPEPELDEIAEEGPFESLPVMRRRRPAGTPAAVRGTLQPTGWVWAALVLAIAAAWTAAVVGPFPDPLRSLDGVLTPAAERLRNLTDVGVWQALALLGSVGFVMAVRWATIALLAIAGRWRHLVTFVAAVLAVRLLVIALVPAIGRGRPPDAGIFHGWEGYAHPSPAVAMLAVAAAGAAWTLVPEGRSRRIGVAIAAVPVVLLGLARVALAIDHPTDVLTAALFGWGVGSLACRLFCPDEVFPVSYERRRGAHHDVSGHRRDAIAEALEDQAGLVLLDVEPFGEEHSGGSTPLRLRVRRVDGRREEDLFAKLYSSTHLRGDRWYKRLRTILYGSLEDEAAFNSVRQLVEHEDYMLRLMREAGVSAVEPRGFVEVDPEREYLILMTLLRRAAEADEDAEVDDDVIDAGLRNVRAMWDHGLAHRDVKPGNVLIHDGRVSLIDVAFGQVRPSPWRQAVDLANMMLVLSLASDADRVYARAKEMFSEDDLAEAFAAARGPAIPRQLGDKVGEDGRDPLARFRALAPPRDPITVQRWSVRRVILTAQTVAVLGALAALVAVNLANPRAP
ncbi:MAG TPA: hypothetical protein VLA82_05930 [Actinomycetota bacterium]|nr:hypothetical protein [Actinomycetota bacterium]